MFNKQLIKLLRGTKKNESYVEISSVSHFPTLLLLWTRFPQKGRLPMGWVKNAGVGMSCPGGNNHSLRLPISRLTKIFLFYYPTATSNKRKEVTSTGKNYCRNFEPEKERKINWIEKERGLIKFNAQMFPPFRWIYFEFGWVSSSGFAPFWQRNTQGTPVAVGTPSWVSACTNFPREFRFLRYKLLNFQFVYAFPFSRWKTINCQPNSNLPVWHAFICLVKKLQKNCLRDTDRVRHNDKSKGWEYEGNLTETICSSTSRMIPNENECEWRRWDERPKSLKPFALLLSDGERNFI